MLTFLSQCHYQIYNSFFLAPVPTPILHPLLPWELLALRGEAYPKKWELNFPSFFPGEAVTFPFFSISHKLLEDLQGGKQPRAGAVKFSQEKAPVQ